MGFEDLRAGWIFFFFFFWYFQLSIETFLQSFLCDVIEQDDRPLISWCQRRFGLSFPGQTSHLLPKGLPGLKGRSMTAQGWDTKRRSAPHPSRCSGAYLLPGPGCRACEGGHGSSSHRLSGCDPGVKSTALLQGTAQPLRSDDLSQSGWVLHLLLGSYRAGRARDRPLGPGLTSRNGCVVFLQPGGPKA